MRTGSGIGGTPSWNARCSAVAAMLLAALVLALGCADHAPPTVEDVLAAIRVVETGGEPDGGRRARGDGGRSLGPFQISRAYWTDARVPGRYEDCRDPEYARAVVLAYWERWCPDALARVDAETLARVHNGGPRGARKNATRAYWHRVRKALADGRDRDAAVVVRGGPSQGG